MRVPSDLPRPRRPRMGSRGRVSLIVLGVVIVIFLTSLRGIAGFYTDLIWFDSLGYRGVFTGILGAKISLTILFTAVFFVLLWANLIIADRLAPRFRPAGPEEEVIERYHELIGNRTGLVRVVVALVLALIAGAGVSGHWHDWVLFTHARDFGIDDPQFNMDVGFYVFRLPFITFILDWAFGSLLVITLVTAVAHYLNGGIRVQGPLQRVTPQVKAHLSVLLGLLALIKAVGYWFQRYELTLSTRGTVDGATYTDVKAQLPAFNLLMLISAAAVVLLIVNIWRRGWVLPVLAVGLWVFVAVVVGTIYPAIIQRVTVQPSESSKEAPYIKHNIAATRAAMGLTDVERRPFGASEELDAATLTANAATVRNIRLWDTGRMARAFDELQTRKSYYVVNDVDSDRYEIDGEVTQVGIAVRDLGTDLPQKSWEAKHLTYTHGQGVVLGPANAKDEDGRPELVVRDVPVRAEGGIKIDQPDVYIGEKLSSYVITNTKRAEIDFEDDEGTKTSTYGGEDGVGIGSYLRRAAFGLRFADWNLFISGNVQSDSKILFHRDVRERVQELAPFLSFDHDPYPIVVDGRIKYVVDAYTTTNRYPYGQRADRTDLPEGSGLDHDFNYVRNSVKAVVDAYDGDVTFYVVDPDDPLAAAYVDAFPELFTSGDEAPAELRAHYRYPEDLFVVQTNMWGRYHLSDPDAFYTNSGAWVVSQDPELTRSTTTTTPGQATTSASATADRMEPYYLLMQLPGEAEPSFLILRPFVPYSRGDERKELTAFMVATSDPGRYGELTTFTMPPGRQVDGPAIVAGNMQAEKEVSEAQTLLGQSGSQVSFGNLIVVPIEDSLLYVRPFFVTSASGARIPEIRMVVAAYGDDVAIADTLQQALTQLFGDAPPTQEKPVDGGADDEPDEPEDVAELLARAVEEFEAAEKALREGNLAEYQRRVDRGRELVLQAQERSAPASASTTTTTAPADA